MNQEDSMLNPDYETLLSKVDCRFTLVGWASKRARNINSYYLKLRRDQGGQATIEQARQFADQRVDNYDSYDDEDYPPPQVNSTAAKPLSIAFEEIAADKVTWERYDPEERAQQAEMERLAEEQAAADAEAELAAQEAAQAAEEGPRRRGGHLSVVRGGR